MTPGHRKHEPSYRRTTHRDCCRATEAKHQNRVEGSHLAQLSPTIRHLLTMSKIQLLGYSGTPLAKKLGIAVGSHVLVKNPPANYRQLLEPMPEGMVFDTVLSSATDIVHVFVTEKSALDENLVALRATLRNDAAVWVSWPKKASKVATDINEDTIRELALPLGFVDIKVCAVTEVWSGLKLVIRKALR